MLFHKFVIIGAGKTGLDIAQRLALCEQDVMLIEASDIGGSYIFSNDYPRNILLQESINYVKSIRLLDKSPKIKYLEAQLKEMIRSKIGSQYKKIRTDLHKSTNLELVYGLAEFASKNMLNVITKQGEKLTVAFEHCLICTGKSEIETLPIKGLEGIDFFHQHNGFFGDRIPKTLAIIGATKENFEVAEIYSNLGSQVTIFESESPEKILPDFDTTSINYLLQNHLRKGVEFYFNIDIEEVKKYEGLVTITDSEDGTYKYEQVYAPVVEKFVDNLDLDSIGIKYSEKGIYCTSTGQTTQKNIWVFGAASNSFKKVNINNQLHNFVERFAKKDSPSDNNKSRSLVLINPQINNSLLGEITDLNADHYIIDVEKPVATVGLPYKQAVSKFGPIIKFDIIFHPEFDGFIKTIYNDHNRQLLGLVLAGEICNQLYSTSIDLINRSVTVREFENLIFNLGYKK